MSIREAFTAILEEIHSVSERRAMGLPETYVRPEVESLARAGAQVYGTSASGLAALVESPDAALDCRLAAGSLLGILGDPRIQALEPDMVTVPGGTVGIGVPFAEVEAIVAQYEQQGVKREWIEKETPRHPVDLASFRIGRYVVTNAEFCRFLDATGYGEIPSSWAFGRFHPGLSNHPVYSVSDAAAEAYAQWLARATGRRFRLPTEAEWEYAAAGREGRSFPWGDYAHDCANTLESGLLMATPVGSFPRGVSCFGALDMAGNVEEWTSDHYAPYDGGRRIADELVARASHGSYRVCRGGAFTRFRDLARCQRRHGPVGLPLYPLSFRLVEEI